MTDCKPRRTAPLAGRVILVTRPRAQAAGLAKRIQEAGGEALILPTVQIEALGTSPELTRALAQLPRCNLAVFVSGNAVRCGWPLIAGAGGWPQGLRAAAVGRGTAEDLRARGVQEVLAPEQGGDSEALLRLLESEDLVGRKVIVFRGQGGRELLADALRARGAEVAYVECYRRIKPAMPSQPLLDRIRAGALDAITATSAEGLSNLLDLLGEPGAVRSVPVFAMHPRIGATARSIGFRQVVVTDSGDEGLLRGIIIFFSGPAAGG
jgi:uroporphyrinogen-III synthase